MIRVLVVDDQQLVREGLVRILGPAPELLVVGECEDGDEVDAAFERLEPDVVVMDVRMKRMDGAEATRLLTERGRGRVLVLTTFGDEKTVAAAFAAGAAGFILKDAPGEDLVRAVRAVARGDGWLDPQVAAGVLSAYRDVAVPRQAAAEKVAALTAREQDVLRLVARGLSNNEIGQRLFIGEGTVKTHIGRILFKLDVRDRVGAIVFAYDHGLVGSIAGPGSD